MRKTWTWLSGRKRPPGEYEELSTGTQWYAPPHVRTQIGSWSPESTVLRADWAAFRDPSGQYYRSYVTSQDVVERQLDNVLAVAADADFIPMISPAWRDSLTCLVGGMAFAQWGVAMAHQHVQRFSLSSTLAQSAQLQVMDKLRNAARNLQWHDLLDPRAPESELREVWTEAAELQPLRRYVEEFLVVQDWGQIVITVNLALLGLLEPFLRELYVQGGRANGDFVTAALGTHVAKDAQRHVAWTDAFVKFTAAEEANVTSMSDWLDHDVPRAVAAVDAIVAAHPTDGLAAAAAATARAELRTRLESLGVKRTDAVVAALEGELDDYSY
jgi:phenol hydroxylase P1 protein